MKTPAIDNVEGEEEYLFVYGTLRASYARLPATIRNMRPPQLLQNGKQWVGTAQLGGYLLYDVGEYPAVIQDCAGDVVHGDLFALKPGDLPSLDEYEGIAPFCSKPYEYRRIKVLVDLQEGSQRRQVSTWLYEYNWPIPPHGVLILDGEYIEYCARLCKDGVDK